MAKTEYNNRIGIILRLEHDEIHINENVIPMNAFGKSIIDWICPNVGDEVAFNVHCKDGTLIYLCVISRAKKDTPPTQAPRAKSCNGLDWRPDMYGVAYGTGEYDY